MYYPDDIPPRSFYRGDSRAALAPFLAHKEFGDTYKWLLYGDDDTQFFIDGALRLAQDFDPDLPWFITGNPIVGFAILYACIMVITSFSTAAAPATWAGGNLTVCWCLQPSGHVHKLISQQLCLCFARSCFRHIVYDRLLLRLLI